MQVPLLDLKAQYARIKDEIRPALDRVIESQSFILGPEVEMLEREFAAYTGSAFSVGVSSGTDALLVSLMALGIMPGDEVITTPFSFFATAGVIARLGAKPVFADIDPLTFNIDPSLVAKAITVKTRAIIPVHLFGQCADMDPIMDVARQKGIPVIEDACQATGAEYKGRKAGALGDIGAFSFFPSKNLGAFGDGGMVVTSDAALHEKIRLLRQHGSGKTYHHKYVGGNFRLDALQAAVLSVKFKHLEGWADARRVHAAFYTRRFSESGLVDRGVIIPPGEACTLAPPSNPSRHVFNQYTLRARDRDGLQSHLKRSGVGSAIYYPVPLHFQECFQDLEYQKGDCPNAERAAAEVLSIPVYPELTDEQKDFVVESIISFYSS